MKLVTDLKKLEEIMQAFYTLTGIVGRNLGFVNILLYFVGLLALLIRRHTLLRREAPARPRARFAAWGILALMAVLFMLWSVFPPDLGLFWSPTQVV